MTRAASWSEPPPSRRVCLRGRLLKAALLALTLLAAAAPLPAADVPAWLPRYDIDAHLDVDNHVVHARERVTWTNRHDCPATELVFNVHSHYEIPKDEVGFLAKMAEILRIAPGESMDFGGPPCQIDAVRLAAAAQPKQRTTDNGRRNDLPYHWRDDNKTALVVPLPHPVGPGESVTIELAFTFRLPQKQGRWGQWRGVTFLSNWLPVVAYYDDKGWQPTPFIPWHQPWFNEAGVYHARVTLPCNEKLACTGSIVAATDLGDGWQQLDIEAPAARDFALVASSRFQEFEGDAGPVHVKVLAFPEHEYYAKFMLKTVCDAIPVYSAWFGAFPYGEFTVVESYFGWNGNECGGLVMIDERVFSMPHLAEGFVDYLVSHEVCHQWWYNAVGTNGYCETFMDEAMATYFSHRLLNRKRGRNNNLLKYPAALEWLPSIYRENYRYYGMYGTLGRGEYGPCVQEMPKFGHVVNLFSMCYDKGGKIIGMIEDRLGEAAFIDFMRIIYAKYFFRILRVADFQRELEEYTGQSWEEFFHDWIYGSGITDWSVERVRVERVQRAAPSEVRGAEGAGASAENSEQKATTSKWRAQEGNSEAAVPACAIRSTLAALRLPCAGRSDMTYRTTIVLHQKADYNEATVLGICLSDDGCKYRIRLPIVPQAGHIEIDDPPAQIDTLPGNRVQVIVDLPSEPKQIAVDPDQVLVDRDPANNYWKCWHHWRVTPLYTFLDETDLTNDYDKWNFIAGPWLFFPAAYHDPWFTRTAMFGLRADAYRTQFFSGGVFAAYRYEYHDVVIGADGLWDHFPWSHTQLGFTFEHRLDATYRDSDEHANRAVLFGRYVFQYGSSLYLPPLHYFEAFTSAQGNFLPTPNQEPLGAERYDWLQMTGLHYHIDYLTPYWDPEGGFAADLTYGGGRVKVAREQGFQQVSGQVSSVTSLPDWTGPLSATRVAARVYGAAAAPQKVEFFPLGGDDRFRGYSIAERQGSTVWVGSVEWRVPLARGLTWDYVDHIVGLRNVYMAGFYDVGSAYINGHTIGAVAHAVGAGLRLDVAWFSFVERTILRLDVAKTVNDATPMQVWLGIQHPF